MGIAASVCEYVIRQLGLDNYSGTIFFSHGISHKLRVPGPQASHHITGKMCGHYLLA